MIWRRLARRWAWAVTGAAVALMALRAPAVWADVRAALTHGAGPDRGQDPHPGAAGRPRAARSAPAAIPQIRSML